MKFEGTKDYIATEDLRIAVNASISLERPLLVKGEPGTGKTVLAEEIAKALDMPIFSEDKLKINFDHDYFCFYDKPDLSYNLDTKNLKNIYCTMH